MKIKFLFFVILFSLISCDELGDESPGLEVDTDRFEPIFLSRESLNNSIEFLTEDEPLKKPGKIYRYNNILLIADHFTGVHAYDNSNPASPKKLGYIKIPGVSDVAMNKNILYANNSVDLVAIDVTDLNNLKVVQRIEDSFDEPLPPNFNRMPTKFEKKNRNGDLIIFKWREIND